MRPTDVNDPAYYHRVACVGAGPVSLTVANDLMPLGYQVTIFERLATPGGLMRINIPSFRLPATPFPSGCPIFHNTSLPSISVLPPYGEL